MKNIRTYSIKRNYPKAIVKKTLLLSAISISFFSVFGNLWFQTQQFLTDISWIWTKDLYAKAQDLKPSWTVWPFEQITDLASSSIQRSSMNYNTLRSKTWDQVPSSLKVPFPQKIVDYVQKYQNITLDKAWNIFKDPKQLDEFTFMRRVVRTTRAASYDYAKIWIRWSGTHAWIDFIWNTWTPIVSIADWLVIKKIYSKKWFWNYIAILHNVDNKYYLSFYGHMNELANNINVWDFVKKWEYVWTVWNTWNSYWSHLHLQINKVFTLQDILNWRVMIGWYHDLQWVKEYTVDPLSFIETYYDKKIIWDDLNTEKKTEENKNEKTENKELDLVDSIAKELTSSTKAHPVADTKATIQSVELDLMDSKIQLWYVFTAKIKLQAWTWKIGITSSNDNLSISENIIENPTESEYNISFKAKSLWETKIQFNDWVSSKTFDVRIYTPSTEKVYGIKVEATKLSMIWDNKITIYPTNKLWQILDTKLTWTFKVYFSKDWKKTLLKTIFIDDSKFEWYVKWSDIGEWKLIVESDDFYAKQNISVDIAQDYSYNDKYSNSIYKLVKSWVVKWDSWNLYPNRNLTRRELLTVLWRSILKVDYEKEKANMQEYIKKHWKFFKDIDWKAYSDPYVFIAWSQKIIKWENSYSLAHTNISKWELLTILTRLFKIKTKEDTLNSWKDLENWSVLKSIADSSKQYGLYPFENYNYFKSWKIISRLVAFETLQRFINYKTDWVQITANNSNSENKDLENALNDIFDF